MSGIYWREIYSSFQNYANVYQKQSFTCISEQSKATVPAFPLNVRPFREFMSMARPQSINFNVKDFLSRICSIAASSFNLKNHKVT